MQNARVDEAQAGFKIAGRNSNNLQLCRRWWEGEILSNGRKWGGTKEPLEEGETELKSWLETQHEKSKIMVSSPITSWQKEGEKVETVTDFLFLDSKITAYSDCSHEIKTLAPWKKAMTNLDSILKSKDITLLTKVHIIKAMVFLVVICGYERWTIHKEGWGLKNWCFDYGAGEDSWESLGLQGDQTSQS